MTATVTCVGLATRDLVFNVEAEISLGEKNFSPTMHSTIGGPATNAAVAIAALGGSPRLVTRLGSDPEGDSIISDLELLNVDVSRVRRVDNVLSPLSTVIVDNCGERTIINHTDSSLIDGADTVTREDVKSSDAVIVDLRWASGALSAINIANELRIPSVVDFDLTTEGTYDEIINSCTHLIFSEPALLRLTDKSDTNKALSAVSSDREAFVGVTLGSKGFEWIENGRRGSHSGFVVDAVNTLGAGDVFHGAFALGLAEGRSIEDIVRWSSGAAALKCRGLGNPTRYDVTDFLKETDR